jgi:hypothetical protein
MTRHHPLWFAPRVAFAGVVVTVGVAVATVPALADDDEDVDLTVEVTEPAAGALTLSYTPEATWEGGYTLLDGLSGETGTQIQGMIGKLTVGDTRATPGEWDLSLTFVDPFTQVGGTATIPNGEISVGGLTWDDPYAVLNGRPQTYGADGIQLFTAIESSPFRALASASPVTPAGEYDFAAFFGINVPDDAVAAEYTTTVSIDLVGS